MQQLGRIDDIPALRSIADSNRLTILRLLMRRPETISSLGHTLGKHAAWVRHHVKALEAVGLVTMVEERTTRNYTEKFYRASSTAFTISMLIRPEGDSPVVAFVSDDFAVGLLADDEDDCAPLSAAVTGSLDGLIALRQGLADIAGCHLLDVETGEYNLPYARHLFPDRDVVVVTLAHREQGLIVAPGNPLRLESLADVVKRGARFVSRNRGSGTRVWLDRESRHLGLESEQECRLQATVADTHTEAASRVASGAADAALGIAAAAERFDLGFVPLFKERYDLVVPRELLDSDHVARVIDRLHTGSFRRRVSALTGYDAHAMGDEYRLAV